MVSDTSDPYLSPVSLPPERRLLLLFFGRLIQVSEKFGLLALYVVDGVETKHYKETILRIINTIRKKYEEMNSSGVYPQEWTNCKCPPADSVFPQANYYRAVERNPPTKEDFLNAVEAKKFLSAPLCDRLAVSMLNTWEGAAHHLRLFPFKADWFIATSSLTQDHGKVKNTPTNKQPAHADWWPFQNVVREDTVVDVRKP